MAREGGGHRVGQLAHRGVVRAVDAYEREAAGIAALRIAVAPRLAAPGSRAMLAPQRGSVPARARPPAVVMALSSTVHESVEEVFFSICW